MPRQRTETPSVPTMKKWLEIYLTWLPKLEAEGGIQEEWAKPTAKGLMYAIKALDNSIKQYKHGKIEAHKAEVQEARARYED